MALLLFAQDVGKQLQRLTKVTEQVQNELHPGFENPSRTMICDSNINRIEPQALAN